MSNTKDIIRQRQEDALDFNAEITGFENGRVKRFLSASAREALLIAQGRKSDPARMLLLDILLLTDPLYRKLYLELDDRLTTIEDAIAESLSNIDERLRFLQNRKLALQHNAYVDEDGKRIYRGENNTAYYEDGTMVDPRVVADIVWEDHHSYAQDYRNVDEAISSYNSHKRDIIEYRDGTVNSTRERMHDHTNPMDHDELRQAPSQLERDMPEYLCNVIEKLEAKALQSPFAKSFNTESSGVGKKTNEPATMDIPEEFAVATPSNIPAVPTLSTPDF